MYGPQSKDLKKFETSFKLHRPYYAGSENNLANFLHKALVLVVEQQPVGEIFNIVDGTPTSFADFIDNYAMKLGFSKPGHIALIYCPRSQNNYQEAAEGNTRSLYYGQKRSHYSTA
ncbi:MAG TPA: hypothetical protein V6C71_06130 [Coleofasciculaceae cyanobacterium]